MNYEKIIIELMSRIQTLEEQVAVLMAEKEQPKGDEKITMSDIREYIEKLKIHARMEGKTRLVIISRDVHGDLDLKSRYPMVCNAMRQCMREGDVILFQPPKGNSSTLEIEYKL